ncbi:hypothetical protein Tco_0884056 [Tanacetum coccineum]
MLKSLSSIPGTVDQYLAIKCRKHPCPKKWSQEKNPLLLSAPRKRQPKTAGKTTIQDQDTQKSASQSAPVEETMQTTDVFEAPAHQEFETGVHDEQAEEEVQHLPDWFQQPTRLPCSDHAWNKPGPGRS